jgi:hypothetical protein
VGGPDDPACYRTGRPERGSSLLTLANVITVAARRRGLESPAHLQQPLAGHARFHGVTALAMATTLSALNIWSIWSGGDDRTTAEFFAEAVPAALLSAVLRGPAGSWHRGR